MFGLSLRNIIKKIVVAVMLGGANVNVQAQPNILPDLFENHLDIQTIREGDDTSIHSRFDYAFDDTLVTRSEIKFNNRGNEDHISVGVIQEFGNVQAQVFYNMHDLNYADQQDEYDDMVIDVQVGALNLQHRVETTQRVSRISVPFDLYAVEVDLTFDQTLSVDSDEVVETYKVASRRGKLSFTALWKGAEDQIRKDIITAFRPAQCCLFSYAYLNTGTELQRQISSQYAFRDYRLTGEINAYQSAEQAERVISAISLEKVTKATALKMRVEYDDQVGDPTFSLQLESADIF